MTQIMKHRAPIVSSLIGVALMTVTAPASATEHSLDLRLTAGSSFQTSNDVQIPNNDFGTRFSLGDTVGSGPVTAGRFEVNWMINDRHGMRLMLAPLSYTESVSFDEQVSFAGQNFSANQVTDVSYRFNSWRVGYHYSFVNNETTRAQIGATLKVRDAEIRLEQADTVSFDDDLGLVPLLYLSYQRQLNNQWSVRVDLDGLAGGPGRAIDAGVAADYRLTNRWRLGFDLRVLDGGADTDDIYNFAQFWSAGIAISTSLL